MRCWAVKMRLINPIAVECVFFGRRMMVGRAFVKTFPFGAGTRFRGIQRADGNGLENLRPVAFPRTNKGSLTMTSSLGVF